MKLSTICYIDNGQEWLMLHRNKKTSDHHQGKWVGVGGKFEVGESPEECARREIMEETGLEVLAMDLKGFITFPSFKDEEDWYSFVFHVTDFQGEVGPCDEGTLKWVAYEDLLNLNLWEGDRDFIQWLLDDSPFFSATFSYEKLELIDKKVVFYPELSRKDD